MRKSTLPILAFCSLCASSGHLHAQQWTDNTLGDVHLDPALPPESVTIGDGSIVNTATLSVRGDQLPVADPFFGGPRLCTFRTDVAALREQSWWMYRDANHIGRIWADGGHRAFHFQNMEPADIGMDRYSGAMVQNHQNDGLWVCRKPLMLSLYEVINHYVQRVKG
jgi:hypothetical protein